MVLILRTLSEGAMHGFGISKWIRERTDGVLGIEDAALYQALHRIERKGWQKAEWGLSENNRRAKYYQLTASGRRQLEKDTTASVAVLTLAVGIGATTSIFSMINGVLLKPLPNFLDWREQNTVFEDP